MEPKKKTADIGDDPCAEDLALLEQELGEGDVDNPDTTPEKDGFKSERKEEEDDDDLEPEGDNDLLPC